MASKNEKLVSVVVPVYNEEENIEELYKRVSTVLDQSGIRFELILVDDGSSDNSLSIIKKLNSNDNRVKYISLSRNFGHEVAITAGLYYTHGDCVVIIDADLQDPPQLIIDLIEKWREGYDVVYARRTKRIGDSFLKKMGAFLFYRVLNLISELSLPYDTGNFRLLDQKVVEAFRMFHEKRRFFRGLVAWLGFKQTSVSYTRVPRFKGHSKYSLLKILALSFDAIFGFSFLPVRLIFILSLFLFFIGFFKHELLCILTALILLSLGIIGEYIARIYQEVQRRPLFIIKETNIDKKSLSHTEF